MIFYLLVMAVFDDFCNQARDLFYSVLVTRAGSCIELDFDTVCFKRVVVTIYLFIFKLF